MDEFYGKGIVAMMKEDQNLRILNLRGAAIRAIEWIDRLAGDPDYGNAWEAKSILESAIQTDDKVGA